jgi:hypothetical protein
MKEGWTSLYEGGLENAFILNTSQGLLSNIEDGADDPSVMPEERVKLEETTDGAYKETEEVQLPDNFDAGFRTCAAENDRGSCFLGSNNCRC